MNIVKRENIKINSFLEVGDIIEITGYVSKETEKESRYWGFYIGTRTKAIKIINVENEDNCWKKNNPSKCPICVSCKQQIIFQLLENPYFEDTSCNIKYKVVRRAAK